MRSNKLKLLFFGLAVFLLATLGNKFEFAKPVEAVTQFPAGALLQPNDVTSTIIRQGTILPEDLSQGTAVVWNLLGHLDVGGNATTTGDQVIGGNLALSGTCTGCVASLDVQTFASSSTWTKPSAGTKVFLQCWGGGGSGGTGVIGDVVSGGGGGGGAYAERWIPFSSASSTETVTIGLGGASRSAGPTVGIVGGNSTFGSWITAYGGGGGSSSNASSGGGGGGGGLLSEGGTGDQTAGLNGGSPVSTITGGMGKGGAGSTNNSHGADNSLGGGGGGGVSSTGTNANAGHGGNSAWGGGGGGGGAEDIGGAGGRSFYGGGGGGGSSNSSTSGAGGVSIVGGNGGAGASESTAGTAGSIPGGGGGGSHLGVSGAGARGECVATTF